MPSLPPDLPHGTTKTRFEGYRLGHATHALVLFHGRGADAEGMLELGRVLVDAAVLPGAGYAEHAAAALPGGPRWCIAAPEADDRSWWPRSGFAPFFENQPWLDGAMARASAVVQELREAGIPDGRIVLGGFSQGACLALEWAGRHATRFGGLLGFSGAMLGPPGTRWPHPTGSFGGTPALLAVHDNDPWVPLVRVEQSAAVLSEKGAAVDARIYRGTAHTILPESVEAAQAMIANVE